MRIIGKLITYNVMRLVAERDLEAQCFSLALLPIRTTNDECSTSTFPDGSTYEKGGQWHGQFPKVQATEKDKGKLLNY